jgi:hypothetical protein
MRGCIPLLHSNKIKHLVYCNTKKICPSSVPDRTSGKLSDISRQWWALKSTRSLCVPQGSYSWNIHIVSQRICMFHLVLITENKYFPMLCTNIPYHYRDAHSGTDCRIHCNLRFKEAVPWLRLSVDHIWPRRTGYVSKTFHVGNVVVKMGTTIGFCLSTSVPPWQYYYTNALYSSPSNVARTRRTNNEC